ncbi:MAG: hypothetical protein R2857_00170 [Vampirovibrionales bacterium]
MSSLEKLGKLTLDVASMLVSVAQYSGERRIFFVREAFAGGVGHRQLDVKRAVVGAAIEPSKPLFGQGGGDVTAVLFNVTAWV